MEDHEVVDIGAIPSWGMASTSATRIGPRSSIRNCINKYHSDLKASARNKEERDDESLKVHEEIMKASGMHGEIMEDNDDAITLFMPNDAAYGKIDDDKLKGLMKSKASAVPFIAAHTVREFVDPELIRDGVHDWPTDNPNVIIRTDPPTRQIIPGLGLEADPVIAYQVARTKKGDEIITAAAKIVR